MLENFQISESIRDALDAGQPVVALESTVITHGLPYPQNVDTARLIETTVRQSGATPATIAIVSGVIRIGISDDELNQLAEAARQGEVRKCSRRDLPIVLSRGTHGGTTVAGTMILAHMAGIELFATGGIGGVHRGQSLDVSADLTELGRTPMTVVCSGAKSILDLPATREVLETEGVTIVGFGTDTLPAFYAADCGLPVDVRLETPQAVAQLVDNRRGLGLLSSTLVTVPIPAGEAIDPDEIESAVGQATQEAEDKSIRGPESTPWLLQRVVELTGGRSLKANVALLENNARVAAEIAIALCDME